MWQETISSKFKGGLLECNFDKELLKMFQEEPCFKSLSDLRPICVTSAVFFLGAVFNMRCLR